MGVLVGLRWAGPNKLPPGVRLPNPQHRMKIVRGLPVSSFLPLSADSRTAPYSLQRIVALSVAHDGTGLAGIVLCRRIIWQIDPGQVEGFAQ
jgi:hypothetical protein